MISRELTTMSAMRYRRAAFGLASLAAGAAAVTERRALRRAADLDRSRTQVPRLSEHTRLVEIERDVELQIAERGSGRPVVLLHGWGMSLDTWSYAAVIVSDQTRFIAVDLRGHGGSSPMPVGADAGLLAADILALLAVLDLRDVVIVGHSFGGIVAQVLASTHADVAVERIRGFLLVSTTARGAVGDRRAKLLARLLSSRLFAEASGVASPGCAARAVGCSPATFRSPPCS